MASWSVFEPPATAPGTLAAADKSQFVKDGFSFGAFLVTPIWLLWRRMWLVFLLWLAGEIVVSGIGLALHLGEQATSILSLLFTVGFAIEANALRAWTLSRKGWRFAGIVCGRNLAEAEYRHFGGRSFAEPEAPLPPQGPRAVGPSGPDDSHRGVLGVFPEPEGIRF
jgi:hypothetical protein